MARRIISRSPATVPLADQLQVDPMVLGQRVVELEQLPHLGRQVDRLASRHDQAVVGLGQEQHVGDHAGEPLVFLRIRVQHLAVFLGGTRCARAPPASASSGCRWAFAARAPDPRKTPTGGETSPRAATACSLNAAARSTSSIGSEPVGNRSCRRLAVMLCATRVISRTGAKPRRAAIQPSTAVEQDPGRDRKPEDLVESRHERVVRVDSRARRRRRPAEAPAASVGHCVAKPR